MDEVNLMKVGCTLIIDFACGLLHLHRALSVVAEFLVIIELAFDMSVLEAGVTVRKTSVKCLLLFVSRCTYHQYYEVLCRWHVVCWYLSVLGLLCWKRRDVWKQGLHSWKKRWMRSRVMQRLPTNEHARVLYRLEWQWWTVLNAKW